jgi:hypothetical protein
MAHFCILCYNVPTWQPKQDPADRMESGQLSSALPKIEMNRPRITPGRDAGQADGERRGTMEPNRAMKIMEQGYV